MDGTFLLPSVGPGPAGRIHSAAPCSYSRLLSTVCESEPASSTTLLAALEVTHSNRCAIGSSLGGVSRQQWDGGTNIFQQSNKINEWLCEGYESEQECSCHSRERLASGCAASRCSSAMGCGCSTTPPVEEKAPEPEAVPVAAPEKSVAEAEAAEGREKREESIVAVCSVVFRGILRMPRNHPLTSCACCMQGEARGHGARGGQGWRPLGQAEG